MSLIDAVDDEYLDEISRPVVRDIKQTRPETNDEQNRNI
jgi:hypothetical protein